MRGTNEGHKSWELVPELRSLTLRTGPDNPYYQSEPDRGRTFRTVLRRDANEECQSVGSGGLRIPRRILLEALNRGGLAS
jgi:hypothetical protein